MDIKEGDILVVAGVDYPVRAVSEYSSERLNNTRTFQTYTTVDATTKRSPAVSSGKRGAPVANLTGLKCTPLDPVDAETRRRLGLETPHELKQTFLADSFGYIFLVLEELKR